MNINSFIDHKLVLDPTQLRLHCWKERIPGLAAEFGVYTGSSITVLANADPSQMIYGFDSFEGLPEEWKFTSKAPAYSAGHFNLEEAKRIIPGFDQQAVSLYSGIKSRVPNNVVLVKGWFDDTLPVWKKEHVGEKMSFIHIDCDIYSSTRCILDNLNEQIVPGTIIVFDELYSFSPNPCGWGFYEDWADHEYKALIEWLDIYNREVEVIGRSDYTNAAIRVIK